MTSLKVYEYLISHHMAKAFESLFGSVTCLPGCFALYRLRTPDTHKPLLISNQLIHDYLENRIDTLHMRYLLHLREDRYLTTLLLKHFPLFKTQFIRDAHAYAVAPDDWKVLLSLDQLDSSQSRGTHLLGAALRFLLFLNPFHCHDASGFDAHTARRCCICKFYPFMSVSYHLITSQDRVFDLPGGR